MNGLIGDKKRSVVPTVQSKCVCVCVCVCVCQMLCDGDRIYRNVSQMHGK